MANGYKALGSTLAGGNAPSEDIAYAQGTQLGANTQNALADARLRVQKADAIDQFTNMSPDQESALGMPKGYAKLAAGLLAQSEKPEDF